MFRHTAWPAIALSALAACLAGTSAALQAPAEPRVAAQSRAPADTGARICNGSCIACRQPDARGVPGVYPSLVGSPVLRGDPAELALWVSRGRRGPSMPEGRYPTLMLKFDWMSAAHAAALYTYLRASYGNSAAPVNAAAMARVLERQT